MPITQSRDNLLIMSMGELIFIGIVILLVVPPEKLPGLAREIARFFNDIRRTTSGVWEDLKKDVPNPVEELRKQKQEVEEYMKFIGAPNDHHKSGPELDPSNTIQKSTSPAPSDPHAKTNDSPETLTTTETPPINSKDEPDKQ